MAGSQRGRTGPRLPYSSRAERQRNPRDEEGKWPVLRAHLIAMSGEFFGTIMFLWFSFVGAQMAVEVSPTFTIDRAVYISLSFGFSLLVQAWAFYRISGGLFNPAVVLGMCVSGSLPWIRGAFLVPAQILGGMVAAALVSCMLPGPISAVNTTLGPNVSIAQGCFIEMFLTAQLVFVILMLAAEKHKSTFIAPIGIGLALFVSMMAGIYFTGASLNPARSFGPAVVSTSFVGYHWIYWVGPALGGLVAAMYYRWVKWMNYEEANPGQDAVNEVEKSRSRGEA